ncbi:MAG: hypothetical protein GEU93_04010 [Propionibacteriales bacterium]|nr:hypothetical protein [Propionibacteriales bacterium]
MTRTRYLVVVAAVMLFSLAIGIALGGGPLQGDLARAIDEPESSGEGPSSEEVALRESAEFDDQFVAALSDDVLAGTMSDRRVLLVALPGADEDTVAGVTEQVEAAGGMLSTTLWVDEELIDPTAKVLVRTLSSRLAKEDLPDFEIPKDTPVYEQVGTVLSRALLHNKNGGVALDDPARSVFQSFATAELVRGREPATRADSVVVIAPESAGGSQTATAQGTIVSALLTRMRAASNGVVLAGPRGSAGQGGLVAAVRSYGEAAESVSTVDTVDRRSGQIVAVLALAEQAADGVGHYGMGADADSAVPGSLTGD